MTNITVELDDAKAKALREKAERYGLKPEQLVSATLEDLIAQPNADFEEAARRVLSKNREVVSAPHGIVKKSLVCRSTNSRGPEVPSK